MNLQGLGWVPDSSPVPGLIDAAAAKYGVDRNLAHVVAQMESQYNPDATSGAGAQGVMQLMPATAADLGVRNSFDPAQNIDAGVRYLSQLSKRYGGNVGMTLAAYNAGPGAVDRYGGTPPYPETRNYVSRGQMLLAQATPSETSQTSQTSPTPQPGPMKLDDLGWVPDAPAQTAAAQTSAPPAPQESAATRFAKGFDTSGISLAGNLIGGLTKAYVEQLDGGQSTAGREEFTNALHGLLTSLGNEPTRISGELQKGGQEILNGNILGGINSLIYAFPLAGGAVRGITDSVAKGDYAGALGQIAGLGTVAYLHNPEAGAAALDAVKAAPGGAAAALDSAALTAQRARGTVDAFRKGAFKAAPEAGKSAVTKAGGAVIAGPHAMASVGAAEFGRQVLKGGVDAARDYLKGTTAAPEAPSVTPENWTGNAPPAAAPATGPIPQAQGGYFTQTGTAGTPSAPEPPAQGALTFEDLGTSLTGKPPSKWTDAERATIQTTFDRITKGIPEEAPPKAIPPDQAAQLFPHVDFGTPAAPSPAAPEAPAVPPAAPEAPPAAEAPEAPAVHPAVQRYTDYLIANGIPGKMVDQFRPQDWELLAPQVNPSAPEVPTAEMAAGIRKNIADFEAKPTTPAELQAKADTFNAAKAAQASAPVSPRGGGAEAGPVAATPTPSAAPPSPAEALAQMMPEFAGKPPAGTPAGAQPLSLQDLMRSAETKETAIQTAAQAYRQANRQGNAIKLAEALYNRGTASADAAQMAVEDLQKLAQTLDVAKKTKSWDLLKQETVLRLQQLEKAGEVSQRQAFEEARADTMAPNAEAGNANVSGTGRQVQAPAQPGNRVKPQTGPAYSGTETSLRIPGESAAYPARYILRELDDIQASHNPHNFQPNPDYALRNDRNYSDPANQERIVLDSQPGKFAPEYLLNDSPDAVNGPPVVEPGGNVVGGNSRAMKLARVYANNPADAAAYRSMLEQKAGAFGIDPAQVKTMRRPVLVRELASIAGDPQKLVTDLNKTGTAALTAVERATADARRLSGAAAEYLGREIEAEGPEASLNDALSGKRGAGIVNKLVEEGIFTPQEKPALVDSRTGAVTAAAKERISKMLLGQVFADSDQMMRTPAEIRNKLERVVSPILQSSARPAYNLIPTVREALNLLEYARAHGIPNLSDAIRQEGLFGGEPDFSAEVARMGQFLKDAKPTAVAKAFRRYMANTESGMFGESTPEQAFDDAFAPPPAK